MTSVDRIRNSIIDRLLAISNKEYLTALYKLVESSPLVDDKVKLTEEQKVMLQMSEEDIKVDRLIPQDQLDKADIEWLRKLK
jgi:hypothetical protein